MTVLHRFDRIDVLLDGEFSTYECDIGARSLNLDTRFANVGCPWSGVTSCFYSS